MGNTVWDGDIAAIIFGNRALHLQFPDLLAKPSASLSVTQN